MLYRHFISNTYTCTSLGQHVQLLYAIGSLSFRTLPLMDAFPQIIKIILLYPQKPLFYMLLHVKTTGADKSHASTIAYIPHIQHRHTTIDLSTRHRLLQNLSLSFTPSRSPHDTHTSRMSHAQPTLSTHERWINTSHISHHHSPAHPSSNTRPTHAPHILSPLPSPKNGPSYLPLPSLPTFHHAWFCHDRV